MTTHHIVAGLLSQSELLAIPVLLAVPAMLYWLTRVLRALRRLHP